MVGKSDFEDYVKDYLDNLVNAALDDDLRESLDRAISASRSGTAAIFKAFPETVEKARKLRDVKNWSLLHWDELIKQTSDMVEDAHGNCFVAKTKDDALEYIGDQVKKGDVIAKAKSITAEELHINQNLEELGCEVYETDLGELILQKLNLKPAHLVEPAIGISREQVTELFTNLMGRKFSGDISEMVSAVRGYLRDVFIKADVGISGANAIAAETGTAFIIENEGNARLVTGLPEKNIIIAGFEKIVPTLMDGMLVSEVTTRYAGYKKSTYLNLITGPSATGDIEKQVVYGVHGPKEVHVILLDNNRTEMVKDDVYRQALRCIRCGRCFFECTVYPLTSANFGHIYMGGIGTILTRYLLGGKEKASPMAYTCTLCGRCTEFCPMEIDIKEMLIKLRMEMVLENLIPERVKQNVESITNIKL